MLSMTVTEFVIATVMALVGQQKLDANRPPEAQRVSCHEIKKTASDMTAGCGWTTPKGEIVTVMVRVVRPERIKAQ